MREYIISKKEAGQRMDKYTAKVLNQATKSFIYKMLRKKNIVLNDKKATGQEILQEADSIKIYFSEETFEKFAAAPSPAKGKSEDTKKSKAFPDIPVVYEDEDILVVNKPAGVLSQKAEAGDYSLNEWVIDYLLESGFLTSDELQTFRPSVANRLDRNTSGLLLAGKTIHGLQMLSEMLKDRTCKKYYHCIVWGRITKPEHLKGYLVKNHRTNQVQISGQKTGREDSYIETSYRPLKTGKDKTLLEVHLITGRSHQIRAHLASVGHPLLGDPKYGDAQKNLVLKKKFGLKYQLLHSCRMEFPDGRVLTAEDPELFDKIQKYEW